MTERIVLTKGSDFHIPDGEPIRVTAIGVSRIIKALTSGAEAVIKIGTTEIVVFARK